VCCLSWNWRERSSVKITERTHEKNESTTRKVASTLRRHLLDKVLVSDLCEELELQPTVFYRWLKEFFENGAAAFQSKTRPEHKDEQKRIEFLEKKIQTKDEVLAELMAETSNAIRVLCLRVTQIRPCRVS
jgi:transposase